MKLYVWRHNRRFHSWSMINEPCVQQAAYTDAIAIVLADSVEQALEQLGKTNEGWLIEELSRLSPTEISVAEAAVIFTDVRGD